MSQENKSSGFNRFLIAVLIIIAVACLAANIYFYLDNAGGLVSWETLPLPPEKIKRLVNADPLVVWVESTNGKIYEFRSTCWGCPQPVWQEISAVSAVETSHSSVERGSSCSGLEDSLFPTITFDDKTKECILVRSPVFETSEKSYFALLSDGTILTWHHTQVGLMAFVFVMFNVLFLVLAGIFVSLSYFIRFVIHKFTKPQKQVG